MLLSRLIQVPALMLLGCLLAGSFGVIHNQISYTVSPEYFTAFKFEQFNITPLGSNRVGAAVVGWRASWWMGIPIGLVLLPVGLFIRGSRAFLVAQLQAYGVVLLTTIAFSVVGLGIGFLFLEESGVRPQVRYGREIVDDLAFCRAGIMHNFSYLGGVLGIITGCVFIAFARLKQLDATDQVGGRTGIES